MFFVVKSPQSILPVTEVYDYTSAPWRRGILDMSRGTKSKAVSGKMEMVDYFRMLNSRLDEQEKRSDVRYETLQGTLGTQISASKN